MKKADIIAIILALVLCINGIFYSLNQKEGASIMITAPSGEYHYSLKQNRLITVKGLQGNYIIEIKDGKVRSLEANCPERICILRSWIYKNGDSIVCVPNKVIIRIESEKQEVDAITQ